MIVEACDWLEADCDKTLVQVGLRTLLMGTGDLGDLGAVKTVRHVQLQPAVCGLASSESLVVLLCLSARSGQA